MDREPSSPRWLCIDCGEIFERPPAQGLCPRCSVQVIELGPNGVSERVAALASAAIAHKRRRVETAGVLGGVASGLGLAVLLGYVGAGGAVAVLAPLLAIFFAGIGWLVVPSVWAGAFVKKNPTLTVPGISKRRRLFAAIGTLIVLPLSVGLLVTFVNARQPKPLVIFVAAHDDLEYKVELDVLQAVTQQLKQLETCHARDAEPSGGETFVWQLKWRVDSQGQPTLLDVDPYGDPMSHCVRRLAATWQLPAAAPHPVTLAAEAIVRRSLLFGTVSIEAPAKVTLQYLSATPPAP